jgi:hypothetical protein
MILKTIKERVTGTKPKFTRAEVLAARPHRNPAIEWNREVLRDGEPAVALLIIPRRRDRWGNVAAKLFRLPDGRKLELDEIGSDVWEMCDGTYTVEAVTKAICAKYRLNRRQGETSVTAYLRMLAERRLVALRVTKGQAKQGANSTNKRANKPAQAR